MMTNRISITQTFNISDNTQQNLPTRYKLSQKVSTWKIWTIKKLSKTNQEIN